MSERMLKWTIYALGIFSFTIWLSVRIEPLFNFMLKEKILPEYWENTKWGELYYFNFIKDFQEKGLPPHNVKYRHTPKHPTLDKADILLFGDSFFDFTRMTTFPEQLSDSLKQKVYYARYPKPLEYLDQQNYANTSPKFLIYETAERIFHERFFKPQPDSYKADSLPLLKSVILSVRRFLFVKNTELILDQLLCRSYLTGDIHSSISTLKFRAFGNITDQTPVYSTNYDVPWLFIASEVSKTPQGYYYNHTPEEIMNYCDNIEDLSRKLKERYNLEMIFMMIPNKFTIYHNVVDTPENQYGNLIPKLYAELERRGIPVINVLDEFLTARDQKLLFYGTDTHWTEEGLHIALSETIQKLNSLNPSGYTDLKPDKRPETLLNPQHAHHKSTY